MSDLQSLTDNQSQVLAFIVREVRKRNAFPSLARITQQFGWQSRTSAAQYVSSLCDAGYLYKNEKSYEVSPSVLEQPFFEGIPFYGDITAGGLREINPADEVGDFTLEAIVGQDWNDTFVLRVRGDSMVEAGIKDGDFVLLKRDTKIENGEIGAVNYDGMTTLKRIYRNEETKTLELKPASSQHDSIEIKAKEADIEVIGLYIGHIHMKKPSAI